MKLFFSSPRILLSTHKPVSCSFLSLRRKLSTVPLTEKERRNKRILSMVGYFSEESEAIKSSHRLYQSIEVQTNRIGLKSLTLKQGQVHEIGKDSNIDPKYAMLDIDLDWGTYQHLFMLHLWMVNRRLMFDTITGDPEHDRKVAMMSKYEVFKHVVRRQFIPMRTVPQLLQESLFTILWERAEFRIRKTGLDELLMNKNLKGVQDYSFAALLSYDFSAGYYTKDNDKEATRALANSIFTHLYQSDKQFEKEKDIIASYVMRQLHHLFDEKSNPYNEVCNGIVSWIKPPENKELIHKLETKLSKGHRKDLKFVDFNELEWRPALSPLGKRFFWNTNTGEATWENKFEK